MNAGRPKGIQGYPGTPAGSRRRYIYRGVRRASSSQEDAGGTRGALCASVLLVLLAPLGIHEVGNRGRKKLSK